MTWQFSATGATTSRSFFLKLETCNIKYESRERDEHETSFWPKLGVLSWTWNSLTRSLRGICLCRNLHAGGRTNFIQVAFHRGLVISHNWSPLWAFYPLKRLNKLWVLKSRSSVYFFGDYLLFSQLKSVS